MTTIIGLKSGKEFVVSDKSYLFLNRETGQPTRVFYSADKKRLITIPSEGLIEFFDEPVTKEAIDQLEEISKIPVQQKKEVDEYDPNFG